MDMTGRDEYYNRAKQEGYRSRAAYKLQQLDEECGLLSQGDIVVDLGAAPGGWLQVAAQRVGASGKVVGVDLQNVRNLSEDEAGSGDGAAHVETVRGDMTEADTRERVEELVGEGGADTVLSDMAPNMSGEYDLDHARSVHLARQAFETALTVLPAGGDLAVKVFDGRDLDDLKADVDAEFEYVREVRPPASRDASSELYLVAKNRLTAPVRAGDEVVVEVSDEGNEGDGIARVEGYTLFVPGTSVGDRVRVRVDEVKPKFGFAEVVDRDPDE
jgi:23S rRNA (uridine2552-2'-O)-methyltransferase